MPGIKFNTLPCTFKKLEPPLISRYPYLGLLSLRGSALNYSLLSTIPEITVPSAAARCSTLITMIAGRGGEVTLPGPPLGAGARPGRAARGAMAATARQGALPARRWPLPQRLGRAGRRPGLGGSCAGRGCLPARPFPQRAAVELMGSPTSLCLASSPLFPAGAKAPFPAPGAVWVSETEGEWCDLRPRACPRTGKGLGTRRCGCPRSSSMAWGVRDAREETARPWFCCARSRVPPFTGRGRLRSPSALAQLKPPSEPFLAASPLPNTIV